MTSNKSRGKHSSPTQQLGSVIGLTRITYLRGKTVLGRSKRHLTRQAKAYTYSNIKVAKAYRESISKLNVEKAPKTELAVIVHLYYTDSWGLFKHHLETLKGHNFDIFITLPSANLAFVPVIKKTYPKAYIIEVPNKGRDVLPFINVARLVERSGYSYLLKLHSKKSTHRTDGSDWLQDIVDCLLPMAPSLLEDILRTLQKPDTGIIGPENQYYPLTVNFEANGEHMRRIIVKLFDRRTAFSVLQENRAKYGFFAGTMFWAKVEAIRSLLLNVYNVKEFENEKGQLDGTFAHALERLLCLITEIEDKNIYEVGPKRLHKINYESKNIPDWSSVYIGPKSE